MTYDPNAHVTIGYLNTPGSRGRVFQDVDDERRAQVQKWGRQHLPNGTEDNDFNRHARDTFREFVDSLPRPLYYDTDARGKVRHLSWLDVLQEEFYEVACEEDPAKLRAELIQLIAVGTAWVEAIDADFTRPGGAVL